MLDLILVFAPAMAAGLLVIATHVPLGREVLRSGIVFLDLAIAQAAGLGVVVAGVLVGAEHGFAVQLAAAAAALAAALFLTWSERRAGPLQEAVIGCLFVISACIALIVLSADPHGGEELRDLLVGQILWVTWGEVVPVALLYGAVLAIWFGFGRRLGRAGFYALFAVTVTASVQLVGIYLVFGSLILPALAIAAEARRRAIFLGYAVGLAGYVAGFAATTALDLPAGPAIVCALALCAILFRSLGCRRTPETRS